MTISVMQIKVWIGDLYIANKMLEEQVERLGQVIHDQKEELKKIKTDSNNSEVE